MMPCRMTTHPVNSTRRRQDRPKHRRCRDLPSFLLMTLGLCVVAMAVVAATARAAPYVPRDDSRILERLSAPGDAIKRKLRAQRAELDRDPDNLDLAVRLAKQYLALSGAESDPRYNGYAQAALAPWWQLTDAPVEVLVVRAMLRQNRHEFGAALGDLSRAVTADPRNAQAWFTAAMVLRATGRLDEAARHCWRLKPLVNALATVGCVSSITALNGRAQDSYTWLSKVLDQDSSADHGLRLWALTALAQMAESLGDFETAEQRFEQARALEMRNGYLRDAYADYLLDRGRAAEVRELLAGETRADGPLLRIALAEQRLNAPELANRIATLRARFTASRLRGDSIHLREEARFTLHLSNDPARALRIAKQNWQTQREPWDARIFLEAAVAARSPAEAAPVLAWLESTGIEDVQIQSLVSRLEGIDS